MQPKADTSPLAVRYGVILLWLVGLTGLALWHSWAIQSGIAANRAGAPVVRAQSFELVDANGQSKGSWGNTRGGATLYTDMLECSGLLGARLDADMLVLDRLILQPSAKVSQREWRDGVAGDAVALVLIEGQLHLVGKDGVALPVMIRAQAD